MSEQKIPEKLEKLLDAVKRNLVENMHFFKKKIKLYEIRRQYNLSVYELGHQLYTTAKSGLEDIKLFAPSIDRLRELESSIVRLREELHTPSPKRFIDKEK
ncbi:MAG: hypothetical protein M1491_05620 [Deltaproteobacteria bacterium]|nr:hypothetical protein [Deltaproteobacteria bacterium]MCL5276386.1 hypothetical protein [Deltaproteobacteria bacterium]